MRNQAAKNHRSLIWADSAWIPQIKHQKVKAIMHARNGSGITRWVKRKLPTQIDRRREAAMPARRDPVIRYAISPVATNHPIVAIATGNRAAYSLAPRTENEAISHQ